MVHELTQKRGKEKMVTKEKKKKVSKNDSASTNQIRQRGIGDKKMKRNISRKVNKTKMAVTADFLKVTIRELQVIVTMVLFLGVSIYLMTTGGI